MASYFASDILFRRDEKYQPLRIYFSLLPLLVVHDVQRAFKFRGLLLNQVKVNDGGFQGSVSEKVFDGVKICSLCKKMGGKAVPEAVKAPASFYTGFFFALIK